MNEQKLRDAIKGSKNLKETLLRLNLRHAGGNYKTLNKYLEKYKIDTSHFESTSDRANRLHAEGKLGKKIPLKEILKEDSNYSRTNLKKRLYRLGLKKRECELCGQSENWNGKTMSLILDHINGVYNDNRINNLRIVCPNCNATLDTHCGKNRPKKEYRCNCGKTMYRTSKQCRSCANKKFAAKREKIIWPPTKELITMVENSNFLAVGKKLGVSDSAIRKRIKNH